MAIYQCTVCGNYYHEELGEPYDFIQPNTKFEDLPDDYTCSLCGVKKIYFRKLKDNEAEEDLQKL